MLRTRVLKKGIAFLVSFCMCFSASAPSLLNTRAEEKGTPGNEIGLEEEVRVSTQSDAVSESGNDNTSTATGSDAALYDEDGLLLDGMIADDISQATDSDAVFEEALMDEMLLESRLLEASNSVLEQEIQLNQTVTGTLSASNPRCRYIVRPDYNCKFSLTIDGISSAPYIDLYRDGVLISTKSYNYVTYFVKGGSTYYIDVYANQNSSSAYGNYELTTSITQDLSNANYIQAPSNKDQAKQIFVGGTYIIEIPYDEVGNSAERWYKFQPDYSQIVNISREISTMNHYPDIELYYEDTLLQENGHGGKRLEGGVDYYLRIRAYDNSERSYGTAVLSLESTKDLNDHEFIEGGDSRSNAPEITVGDKYLSMFPQAYLEDQRVYWYKFSPAKNMKVRISLDKDFNMPSTIFLYRGDTLLRKGTFEYHICVNARDVYYLGFLPEKENQCGPFAFTIYETSTDLSDSLFVTGGREKEQAEELEMDHTFISELPQAEQDRLAERWYKICPETSVYTEAVFLGDMAHDDPPALELWREDHKIRSNTKAIQYQDARTLYMSLNGGDTYYLRITANNTGYAGVEEMGYGTFYLKLYEKENLKGHVFVEGGSSRNTAVKIEPAVQYLSELPVEESETVGTDWYQFTVQENQDLEVVLKADMSKAPNFILYEGTKVKATSAGKYSFETGKTYFIKMAAGGSDENSWGGYRLYLKPDEVPVSGISLDTSSASMNVGESFVLKAEISPANATNKNIEWSSSNTSVASVDQNGKVTAVSKGNAVITARTQDGNKTASCTVSVTGDQIDIFIKRLYRVCLNREADSGGLNHWGGRVRSGELKGIALAGEFVFSKEFTGKNYCNEHFVRQLYQALMGREADSGGLNHWVGLLESGKTREAALNSFASSNEYRELCSAAGIELGPKIKC